MKPKYPLMGEFECGECGKTFATKNELIEHENRCDSVDSKEEEVANPSFQEETSPEEDEHALEADKEALDESQSGSEEGEDADDFEKSLKGRNGRPNKRKNKNKDME